MEILKELFPILLLIGTILLLGFVFDFYRRIKYKKIMTAKLKHDFYKMTLHSRRLDLVKALEETSDNLDDISWNDMEMDSLFNYLDQSFCLMGSQALYQKLKKGDYDKKEEEIISEILSNQKKALDLGLLFISFGSLKDKSLFRSLASGIDLGKLHKLRGLIYLCSLAPIYTILAYKFLGWAGLLSVIPLYYVNYLLNIYLSKKSQGQSATFSRIRAYVGIAQKIATSDLKLGQDQEWLKDKKKFLDKALKSVGKNYSKTGSDADFIYDLLNVFCLLEARNFFKSTKFLNENLDKLKETYLHTGRIDMYLGLASLRQLLKDNICLRETSDKLEGQDLHNPLMYFKGYSVANSFSFSRPVILTGSNASGKSSFLRTIGMSQIMAQGLGFAIGKKFTSKRVEPISSIDISDCLDKKISYFMAETIAIKRMLGKEGQIFILDEVFKGTNTHDRIAAAKALLNYLSKENFVIAATHDIELTEILKDTFDNYHFEEEIKDGDIIFDYKLKKGPTTSRNAIEILKLNKYPEEIVEEAQKFKLQ